jgi:hypothetical protein
MNRKWSTQSVCRARLPNHLARDNDAARHVHENS